MKLSALNKTLFFKLNSLAKRSWFFDHLLIFGATYLIFLALGFLGVIFFSDKLLSFFRLVRGDLFFLGLVGMLCWFLSLLIKVLYFIPRPHTLKKTRVLVLKNKKSSAFPSAHTALLFALGGFLLHFHLILGGCFLFLGFLIGLARVLTGIHWPLDFLGGAVLGLLLAWLSLAIFY